MQAEDLVGAREGRFHVVSRAAALDHALELIRSHGSLYQAAAAGSTGAFSGRGTPHVLPTPLGDWVVRHYRRGGLVGRLVEDRYLRLGRPRPLRELRVSDAARSRGIPTPRVLVAAVEARGPTYRGDIAVERVRGTRDLAEMLFGADSLDEAGERSGAGVDPDRRDAALAATGRLIRVLHERGLRHPDLNLKNILLQEDGGSIGEAWVLDLDRARLGPGPAPRSARRRMLDRFHRSLRKWERAAGVPVPAAGRAALEGGYAAWPPSSR